MPQGNDKPVIRDIPLVDDDGNTVKTLKMPHRQVASSHTVLEMSTATGLGLDQLKKLMKTFADDPRLWTSFSARVHQTYVYGRDLQDHEPEEPIKVLKRPKMVEVYD